MQSDSDGSIETRREIKLRSPAGDYRFGGFSEEYAEYLKDKIVGAELSGGLCILIGLAIALVGGVTAIFGPSTVTYSVLSGPTLLQYIQLYPGPIFSIGSLGFVLGTHLYSRKAVSREAYLCAGHRFIGCDGKDVTSVVEIRYLGEDSFHISTN